MGLRDAVRHEIWYTHAMHFLLIIGLIFIAGCTGTRDQGEPTYLLPVLDEENHQSLREVRIPTLSDPYHVQGPAATVMVNPHATPRFEGEPATAKLSRSGSLFIPNDVESGIALSVYSTFENLYFFEHRIFPESLVRWPRQVGIFFEDNPGQHRSLEDNNAFYDLTTDQYTILPFVGPSKTPMALNKGILAHEHFHSHFEMAIGQYFPNVTHLIRSDQEFAQVCPIDETGYQVVTLRGWTEGLADFYGAIYAGRPDILSASLDVLSEVQDRKLDNQALLIPTHQKIASVFETNKLSVRTVCGSLQNCAGGNVTLTFRNKCESYGYYYLGTQIARVLYGMMVRGEFATPQTKDWPKSEQAARFVLTRLSTIGESIRKAGLAQVEPDDILKYLVNDAPSVSAQTCSDLKNVLGSNDISQRYQKCL